MKDSNLNGVRLIRKITELCTSSFGCFLLLLLVQNSSVSFHPYRCYSFHSVYMFSPTLFLKYCVIFEGLPKNIWVFCVLKKDTTEVKGIFTVTLGQGRESFWRSPEISGLENNIYRHEKVGHTININNSRPTESLSSLCSVCLKLNLFSEVTSQNLPCMVRRNMMSPPLINSLLVRSSFVMPFI